jgi:hypothetical protein
MKAPRTLAAAAIPAVLLASLVAGSAGAADTVVVASGLNNPRGIDVGGGRVVVAELGEGRLAIVRPGSVRTLVDGFPVADLGEGELSGVTNVALVGRGGQHVTIGGGEGDEFSTLLRLGNLPGPDVSIADYQVTDPDPLDIDQPPFPEESNPYGIASLGNGKVLVADAAGNDLLLVNRKGKVRTVATFPLELLGTGHLPIPGLPPALPAEAVPTSVAVGPDGYWYVGELKGFPFTPGASNIWRIAPWAHDAVCDDDTSDGCERWATGFTSITGLDVGDDGTVYVVEIAKGGVFNLFSGGDITGGLFAVRAGEAPVELAAGELTAPADVAVAGDGSLYVTNKSVMPDGEVLRVFP